MSGEDLRRPITDTSREDVVKHARAIVVASVVAAAGVALSRGNGAITMLSVMLAATTTATGGRPRPRPRAAAQPRPWSTTAFAAAAALLVLGTGFLVGNALGVPGTRGSDYQLVVAGVLGGLIWSAVMRLPPEWRR